SEVRIAGPGSVAIVPPNWPHSVKVLARGRAIVVDSPIRVDSMNRGVIAIDADQPIALKAGEAVRIGYRMRNWGSAPALVKRVTIECAIASELPAAIVTQIATEELPTLRTIASGETCADSLDHPALTADQIARIHSGADTFFIRGAVFY